MQLNALELMCGPTVELLLPACFVLDGFVEDCVFYGKKLFFSMAQAIPAPCCSSSTAA
jgi:hypothetical protein